MNTVTATHIASGHTVTFKSGACDFLTNCTKAAKALTDAGYPCTGPEMGEKFSINVR